MTCLEIIARFHRPPATPINHDLPQNYLRFRLSPDITVAMVVSVAPFVEGGRREDVELIASRHPRPGEMEAYSRVLSDAVAGDATLFARQDYVEEAWRIVDPVLKAGTPVYVYEPHTWGPDEVKQTVVPPGGWDTPHIETPEGFRVVSPD